MSNLSVGGINPYVGYNITSRPKAEAQATKSIMASVPQMTQLSNVSFGRDIVKTSPVLKAGEEYKGKSFDVQALGSNPITIIEVTPDNIDKLSKCIDIWYQGGSEKAKEAVAKGEPDPRFLHPKVGETMQIYGLEPMSSPYVTKDPETIDYVRKNNLTDINDKGEECFINAYNGDKAIIESTYTNSDGQFLSEVGGVKGFVRATQVKDMKVALLPVGSKVVPLESDNPKTVGVGDVVCCAVKKGKAKNDWYVKPVTEFLKTAKANPDKGNTEFIAALTKFVENGGKDPVEWNEIISKFS